jgi:hypothetical protein
MREAASLRCEGGGAKAASGRGVATMECSEASVAWAPECGCGVEEAEAKEELVSVIGDGGVRFRARRHHGAQSRKVSMAWARRTTTTTAEVTTTTTTRQAHGWGSMWVSDSNDNYGGGDDNYPRVVVKMGRWDERKDVAGTGKNSCR